eukprot:768197-Hanusia_phi.AAC.3
MSYTQVSDSACMWVSRSRQCAAGGQASPLKAVLPMRPQILPGPGHHEGTTCIQQATLHGMLGLSAYL